MGNEPLIPTLEPVGRKGSCVQAQGPPRTVLSPAGAQGVGSSGETWRGVSCQELAMLRDAGRLEGARSAHLR